MSIRTENLGEPKKYSQILRDIIDAEPHGEITDERMKMLRMEAAVRAGIVDGHVPPPPPPTVEERREQARRELAALQPLGPGFPEHQRIKRIAERERLANIIAGTEGSKHWWAPRPNGDAA